jgi:beta-glucosidase
LAWQPGPEGGNTVADVLKGVVNPSGKLTMTFPISYMDVSSSTNFPYDYQTDMQKAFNVLGNQEENKELVRNVDYTNYEEGISVGYRYFDAFEKAVSFPFGFGLSYTQFAFENASVSIDKNSYTFSCTIRNTGNVAGKEVVQLYISAPGKSMNKPVKELKAFIKTNLLQPGESQTVQLLVPENSLASYDEKNSQWMIEPGEYSGLLGSSSGHIRQNVRFNISQ